jgi:outer membrane receptor protein involved in Fe transport
MAKRVQDMVLSADNMRNVESFGFNNRPHKFNVFTRYQFHDGPLENLFLGGGVRWQSANRIQRELIGQNEDGTDLLGDQVLKGNEIFQTDFFIGYTFTHLNFLGMQGGWLRIQFNVYNLFDNDDLNIIRYNRAEDPAARDLYWRAVPQTPRQYRLTFSLSF